MSHRSAFRPVLHSVFGALAVLLALSVPAGEASAQSRREREAEAVKLKMAAAEGRYREALVKIDNNDPAGLAESNAALEDMEDVLTECVKTKSCPLSQLLTSYKRLLKRDADARASDEEGEADAVEGGVIDAELATAGVPRNAEAAALLSADGQRFKDMVRMNPAVQAGIRRWLTDMRVSLIQTHENYQYMRHLMSPAFQRQGLPEALLFGILAKESNGRVHSGSRVGAVGPLQFMPSTGRRFGLGPDGTGFDTRYDPRASSDAAAAYLSERYAELGNNIELWLAAYNGGEGRALRVHRASGGRSFWDEDVYNQFPAETRDYVPMVIAAAWLYLHPQEYGLSFPRVDARPATIRLARPTSIYELTICLGNGGTRDGYMRALRNLNPRYAADSWIPAGTDLNATVKMAGLYTRFCLQGERAELARQLIASDPKSAIVRVGPVETDPTATDDEVAAQAAAGATTPDTAVSARDAKDGKGGKSARDGRTAKGKNDDKADRGDKVGDRKRKVREHKVGRGDTLASIARRYSCDTGDLAKANGLKAPRYAVRVGQRIKLQGCGD